MWYDLRVPKDPANLQVSACHLDAEVEALVRDWFAGKITDFTTSGQRSVLIPVPGSPHRQIKIKGAGNWGKPIKFGDYQKTGPAAPLFDYDGRRMVDVALGHDGAFTGGCSMQQAVTEWKMTARVQEIGYPTVPCLGYGSILDGPYRSWFSVLETDDRWIEAWNPPFGTKELFDKFAIRIGEIMLELARDHRLIGFAWMLRDENGATILKDLHPFRQVDPFNMSQISWVMQIAHALNMNAINYNILRNLWYKEHPDTDAPLHIFRTFCPGLSRQDWDQMQRRIVNPYMHNPPKRFPPETLWQQLCNNPITARLIELCPPEYARYQ